MAISPALSILRTALLVNEEAAAVASRNIANANTPGYTRLAVELGALSGGGVGIAAVFGVLDPILDRRLLVAEGDRRHDAVLRDQLSPLGAFFSSAGEGSLGALVDGFFDAAAALEGNPGGVSGREMLLARAAALANQLNGRSVGIARMQRDADDRYTAAVARANDDLRTIADLNRAIVASEARGAPASELRDQRRQALADLTGLVGATAVEDAHGAVTVAMSDGTLLVSGGDVTHSIALRASRVGLDGRPLHDAGITDPAGNVVVRPGTFTSGELAALVTARDEHIPAVSAALDTLAVELRDRVNAIQTDPAARDRDGNPTVDAPFFGGTGAKDLVVVLHDPSRIAAALSDASGDGQNASRLAALRTLVLPGLGDHTFAGWVASRGAQLDEEAGVAADAASVTEAFFAQLQNQRAALSGVDLDQELATMAGFQRTLQAASQAVQIADAMLDSLLDMTAPRR